VNLYSPSLHPLHLAFHLRPQVCSILYNSYCDIGALLLLGDVSNSVSIPSRNLLCVRVNSCFPPKETYFHSQILLNDKKCFVPRKVQKESASGSSDSERVRLKLCIEVEVSCNACFVATTATPEDVPSVYVRRTQKLG
jgi:hypothetical protein